MTAKSLTFVLNLQDKFSSKYRQAGKNAESSNKMIGGSISGVGVALVGMAAIVGPALGKMIGDAQHSADVAAQTAAVIKSTGGVANVTSGQIGKLSSALMFKTGVDDEAIRTGANMLLTFTGIHNAAGKNNDIFNQATSTILDMTSAMNGGNVTEENMRAMSVKVGKALNDPIKGLSALGKMGVQFTEGQKDQIKAMVASGNTMGAQKIILGELKKEFGGSAAAVATPFKKLKATLGELSETVGGYLLPVATRLTDWFVTKAVPVIQNFAKKVMPFALGVFRIFAAGLQAIGKGIMALPGPFKIAGLAVIALGIAMKLAAAANPWVLLATGIILLVGIIVKNWGKIKAVTSAVFGPVLNIIRGVFNWIKANWPLLLAIITGPIGLAVLMVVKHWGAIKKSASDAFNAVVGWFKSLPGRITSAVGNLAKLLYNAGKNVILGLFNGAKFVWSQFWAWERKLGAWIISLFTAAGKWLYNAGKNVIAGLWNGLKIEWGFVSSWTGKIGGWIKTMFFQAGTWLYNAGKNVIQGFWNGLTFIWTKVTGWIGGLAKWIKDHKGPISLDNKLLEPAGRALMNGLRVGILGGFVDIKNIIGGAASNIGNWLMSGAGKIGSFFSHLFGGGGGGGSWDSVILQALSMLGQSASWLPVVRARLMQESGGNDSIVNRWDSNWLAGTPSVGGMQVIGPTFAAYAGPFRGVGPFLYGVSTNRLANVYAGLNYALHRYGSLGALTRPGGYAGGTLSASRGWAWVGERGPELVNFSGGERVMNNRQSRPGGTTYVVNVSAGPLARPADIGREVVGAIREYEKRAGKGWRS
jgi:hypothetical protein